jgi:putative oxidoreductase
MTDSTANMYSPANRVPGEVAMSRLADRLAAMAPPPLDLSPHTIVRQSPAVQAALTTSAAIAKRADERARRSRRSIVSMTVDSFVSACSFIPYALVALGLRLIMARVFFLDGQTRIDGPRLPLDIQGFDLSVVLPLQVKAETFTAFLTQYPPLPVSPVLAAYALSYAEFILPVMLVLGFGTRFAALGLMIITALIQVYVLPEALWSVHVYWAAILMVLLSRGPGPISVDHMIRLFTQRER